MQIFVTNPDPVISANNLWANPKRAMKMITESQQILACALVHLGCNDSLLLKVDGTPFKTPKSRMNHPVVKWAGASRENFKWVCEHLLGLYQRYSGAGFKNVNANLDYLALSVLLWGSVGTPDKFLNFAKADAKGLDFTHIEDVFEAYRLFLEVQK